MKILGFGPSKIAVVMLTFPSPVSVRPTSDHRAYQISPVWFVNSRVFLFWFVFLKQKSLSHKHSKV